MEWPQDGCYVVVAVGVDPQLPVVSTWDWSLIDSYPASLGVLGIPALSSGEQSPNNDWKLVDK